MDISSISRLHRIFSDKKWHDNLGQVEVHESICKLLSCLNSSEKELMLELIERYEWIPYSQYGQLVKKIFDNLGQTISAKGNIYVFPLKKIKDQSATKSADALIYTFQGFVPALDHPFKKAKYILIDKFEKLTDGSFALGNNDDFFLMDDFLGTGNSLKSVIQEITKNTNIPIHKITILSLVAHNTAISVMESMGIRHSVALIKNKGITDHYHEPVRSEKIKIMRKIESNITTNKRLLLGYMGSDGLVTMIRTPNNTFPVFWMEYKYGKEIIDPPFPRFQLQRL